MKIILALRQDFETVKEITQTTIRTVYPHYYPAGAVTFFSEHHSDDRIMRDIDDGNVYLLIADDGAAAGTVTISRDEINRLFVLPSYQHRGYGRALLDIAEAKILETYDEIRMDASLPAKKIYLRRGYTEIEYNVINTDNGDHLCYDRMVLKRPGRT
ncbi:N-acetylglutamate synthase, GNAT family [Ruminococcaceae bacterium YRB3002]|nr:N-acetylglutamate synthase, GNAT family [Ruminococcaceae bacterium YRB3002]